MNEQMYKEEKNEIEGNGPMKKKVGQKARKNEIIFFRNELKETC